MERDFAKEHDQALTQIENEKSAIRKQYSIRDATRRTNEIVTVQDETLGELRFGVLSIAEFNALDLSNCKSKEEMLRLVVHAMFKKADPELTLKDIEAMPMDDYTIITGVVTRYLPGFLRLGQQLLRTGSMPR